MIAAQSRKLRPTIARSEREVELDADRRRGVASMRAGARRSVSSMQAVHVEDHRVRPATRARRARHSGRSGRDDRLQPDARSSPTPDACRARGRSRRRARRRRPATACRCKLASRRRTISCTCGFSARRLTDDRLLDLARRVFVTGSAGEHCRGDRRAARLAEQQRRVAD